MIGQTVGNYRITKLLGEGGMGAVYLAEHPGIGRKAAVKVLHPELTSHTEIATRFFNEARAANAIRHPGIVEVIDFGTLPSGVSYIVMEFLQGESLAKRLQAGPMPISTALRLVCEAADALGAAHAAGIVHRDLKPDNLFLVPDPRNPGREMVKVLDFGIAKLGTGPTDAGSVKTRTGAVMGTPIYMSPEQCRGTREVDHRADIYALGVILYEMLCGTPPFVSEGQGELIHLHISAPPPSPRSKNPSIPERLEGVILRALAKEPSHRFDTMAAFAQALAGGTLPTAGTAPDRIGETTVRPATARTVPQTTLSASPSVIERALTTKRSRPRFAAVLGTLALAGGAAYFVLPRLRTAPAPVEDAAPSAAAAPASPALAAPAPRPASDRVEKQVPSVTVKVTSEPPGARVVREKDGAVLGMTPLRESWPPSTGVEKLRLELDGYHAESVVVPLDRGVELAFPLKRIVAAPTHRKQPREHATATAPPPPQPSPAPPSLAPAPAPAAPAKPRPKAEPVPL